MTHDDFFSHITPAIRCYRADDPSMLYMTHTCRPSSCCLNLLTAHCSSSVSSYWRRISVCIDTHNSLHWKSWLQEHLIALKRLTVRLAYWSIQGLPRHTTVVYFLVTVYSEYSLTIDTINWPVYELWYSKISFVPRPTWVSGGSGLVDDAAPIFMYIECLRQLKLSVSLPSWH